MNEKKLIYFKGLLEGRLHALIQEAEKTMNDMVQERKGNFADPTDRASFESDRNFLLRIRDRERTEVSQGTAGRGQVPELGHSAIRIP